MKLGCVKPIGGMSVNINVGTAVSLDGGDPGVGTSPHSATTFIVPPGSADTHQMRFKLPREEPPLSPGLKGGFQEWVEYFGEYAETHGFSRILDGAVPLGMSNPMRGGSGLPTAPWSLRR